MRKDVLDDLACQDGALIDAVVRCPHCGHNSLTRVRSWGPTASSLVVEFRCGRYGEGGCGRLFAVLEVLTGLPRRLRSYLEPPYLTIPKEMTSFGPSSTRSANSQGRSG